jgi:hypothetical protein
MPSCVFFIGRNELKTNYVLALKKLFFDRIRYLVDLISCLPLHVTLNFFLAVIDFQNDFNLYRVVFGRPVILGE